MNAKLPDFNAAQYLEPIAPSSALSPSGTDTALLLRSFGAGLVGVLAGAVLYGGFLQLTHINIGYLAIVVAWLVAKAMLFGSGEQGGRPYQIGAVVLTCLSVAMGNALMLYWSVSKTQSIRLSPHNVLQLMRFGLLEPVYEFQDSVGGALLSLFILFIGLRAAWRMTSGLPDAARHPFSRGF